MHPSEVRNKRILLSPLNWGLGHVSRCLSLINELLANENYLVFAGNELQIEIVSGYFPDLPVERIDDYPFNFSGKGSVNFDLIRGLFDLLKHQTKELKTINRLKDRHDIDLIISDHRYGCFHSGTSSIIITHQLNLPVRGFWKIGQLLHQRQLRKFNWIWVMDDANSTFAGKLSRNTNKFNNLIYIGPYSRFTINDAAPAKSIDHLVIVSGPAVFARQYLIMMQEKLKNIEVKWIIPQYLNDPSLMLRHEYSISNDWKKCDEWIKKAKKIYSRSGYSTIMDLHFLNVPSELIATRGQSEQEYLAELWNKDTFSSSCS